MQVDAYCIGICVGGLKKLDLLQGPSTLSGHFKSEKSLDHIPNKLKKENYNFIPHL